MPSVSFAAPDPGLIFWLLAAVHIVGLASMLGPHEHLYTQERYELTAAHIEGWRALLAPPGTPRAIVERLQREIKTAVARTDLRDSLIKSAFEPIADSPGEFARYLATERSKWAMVVKSAGIKPE